MSVGNDTYGITRIPSTVGGRGVVRVDEAGGLLTVDDRVEVAMEERVFHVQLMDGPPRRGGEAEHHAYSRRLHHRAESLVEVDAVLLCEAAEDLSCLVAPSCRQDEVCGGISTCRSPC